MKRLNILVTGGAGFIGSHLVNKLIDLDHNVTIVDNFSSGSAHNLNKKSYFIEGDLSDKSTIKKIPNNINVVFHLAAQVSNEASYKDPSLDLKANVFSTLLLLEWAKTTNVQNFVFTSTMGVYQDSLGYAVVEDSPKLPRGFYGINKLACEEYIRIFSEEGMKTNILRLFNVYGPGQNMNDLQQGMLSIYMSFIWREQELEVKGPLERIRDFLFIDDAVEALLLCGFSEKEGATYNISTNRASNIGDTVSLIKEAFGVKENYPTKILARTPRDIDAIYGNYSKILNDLSWQPRVGLEEGIQRMVDWLKQTSHQR
jgi:UDP-glucose 4-epimerase